ncbi:DUF2058 domain-containing protein [Alkalimarinus coralli]|uniref:DUF2058 domain-containing protein n=1 Tax=Alkalimarinus coralli TaxID=2935863 RepID=UPI00202B31F6|nr:DUF2058 domain-containing protein [Alkalimarinus coralli]
MSGSLQDQLLNMGLANKKQAQEAKAHKRKKAKKTKNAKKAGELPEDVLAKEQKAAAAREEQIKRDKELNLKRQAEKEKRAAEAEIKQLIESNTVEIPEKDSDIAYNFVHGTQIKKIYVNKELQTRLVKGLLSIAIYGDSYRLVPVDIAERIHKRDPDMAICIEQKNDIDPDDPYADYQVPDDLMW